MPGQVRHKADTAFGADQAPNVTTVPRSNTIYQTALTDIEERDYFICLWVVINATSYVDTITISSIAWGGIPRRRFDSGRI